MIGTIEMVTDRTEADVAALNSKGVYGIADLNRVESAVAELLELASSMGFNLTNTTKTDWANYVGFSAKQWPAASNMTRYIKNVHDLCDKFLVRNAYLPRTMSGLTWRGANAIEESLQEVYDRIQNIISIYRYSGEIYSGEEIGL